MKRFLFLICGAALLLIAGARFLILAGERALSPNPFCATVQIQFPHAASLPPQEFGLTDKLLTPLAQSKPFVKQLGAGKFYPVATSSQAEVIRSLQTLSAIRRVPGQNSVQLTFGSYDAENALSIASILARRWLEEYALQATILPATLTEIRGGYLNFLRSPIVLIPLLASIAGAILIFFGWRMATTHNTSSTSPALITAKY